MKCLIYTGNVRMLQEEPCTCQIKTEILSQGYSADTPEKRQAACYGKHLYLAHINPSLARFESYEDIRQLLIRRLWTGQSVETDEQIVAIVRTRFTNSIHVAEDGLYFINYGLSSLQTPAVAQPGIHEGISFLSSHAFFYCASFQDSNIENAVFENAIFYNCVFTRGILKSVVFKNCVFVGCRVARQTWEKVTFLQCQNVALDCDYTTLKQVSGVFERSYFSGERSILQRCTLGPSTQGIFYSSQVQRCKLGNITLRECSNGPIVFHACIVCKQQRSNMTRIHRRGWICAACKSKKDGARTPNSEYRGKRDSEPVFSIECEVHDTTDGGATDRALVLLTHGYIKCDDGSVDDEYKSPIYLGLVPALPALRAMETFSDLIDGHCGTHIHVDCRVIHSVAPEIFERLVRHMEHNADETRKFWGRYFSSSYANTGLGNSRYNAFSVGQSHYSTIEYRLPRFRNVKQFLGVLRFVRSVTKYVTDTYTYTPSSLIEPDAIGRQILNMYRESVKNV